MTRYCVPRDYGGRASETLNEYRERFGQSAVEPPDLDEVDEALVTWFRELSSRRQRDSGSPQPLTYAEVESWRRQTRVDITSREVGDIMAMDDAFLESYVAEESRAGESRQARS